MVGKMKETAIYKRRNYTQNNTKTQKNAVENKHTKQQTNIKEY
jgi:hypothetical protein